MSDSTLPPTPNTGDKADRDARPVSAHDAEQLRDGINRERLAIRRLLREMTNGEHRLERKMQAFEATELDAKSTIERHSRVEHWGREPERPWAWRTTAPDPEGPNVSWRALGHGADVISADGLRVGAVEHVLADAESDIFDGVVIDTRLGPGGLRAVDAAQIALIFEDRIMLTVSRAQVHDLPAPTRNRAVPEHRAADPMASALKRRLGKRWRRISGR
jgi:hypothetical protein